MIEDAPDLAIETARKVLGGAWAVDATRRDGSDRLYVRLRNAQDETVMAMIWPSQRKGGEAGADADPARMVVEVTQALASAGLPVPQLLGQRDDLRVLLLEDLGHTHLSDLFGDGVPVDRYAEALELLHRFQRTTFATNCPILTRSYDSGLWHWEFDHFREWGVEHRSGEPLPSRIAGHLDQVFRDLAERLASAPAVPVHRDYHCRNLMIDPLGRLRWIDYQDALTGHPFYDVASLLWDAYVEIDNDVRMMLFEEWLSAAAPDLKTAFADAEAEVALVAMHRMLKAAGRFVLFVQQKSLGEFAAHIPGLLTRVEALAATYRDRLPVFDQIVEPLRPYVPEWRT